MNRFTKRRALPLLLFFALLIVSLAILIPTAASADPEPAEMADLSCQTLTGLDLADPEGGKTVLRCLFTIGSLDYKEVGFVFSKENATVEKNNSPKPNYVSATKVYNSIIAGGDPVPAGENRWWVAVELQNIPHDYFDSPIYVRAFVTDTDAKGGETRYSGVYCITVCAAAGHTHTVVEDYDTLGTATMKTPGTLIGHCNGCNLDNVTEYNVANRNAFIYDMKALNGTSVSAPGWGSDDNKDKSFLISKSIGEIRGANKHFFPDSTSIGAQGNDLWFEYSFLMNATFWNYDSIFGKGEMKAFSFRLDDPEKSTENDVKTDFYYLYGSDGATDDCPYKGHFDYSTYKSMSEGHGAECAEDLTSENIYYRGNRVGRFGAGWTVKEDERAASPYLFDSETASEQMYGWHRLGFRYHQEVESVSNTGVVTYSVYTELYLDGVKVWKVQSNVETLVSKGLLLWTAITGGDSTIDSYTDNDNMLVEMYLGNAASEEQFYVGIGDVYWTCGDGFQLNVAPIETPSSGDKIDLGGNEYSAEFYYGFPTAAPTTPTVSKSPASGDTNYLENVKSLSEIQGDDHFYPTLGHSEGKNLFFEYSILWNNTLSNWSKAEMKVATIQRNQGASRGNYKDFYYLLTKDGASEDCPFAGHFDYSCYLEGCDPEWSCAEDPGNGLPIYKAGWANPKSADESPYIGEYGWHRIGVLIHQKAEIVENNVKYTGYTELFVDGVKVWKVKTNMDALNGKGLLLFTATKNGGELSYQDNANKGSIYVGYRFDSFYSETPTYVVIADARWRIVDTDFNPTSEFEPIANPTVAYYQISDGPTVRADVYFKAK